MQDFLQAITPPAAYLHWVIWWYYNFFFHTTQGQHDKLAQIKEFNIFYPIVYIVTDQAVLVALRCRKSVGSDFGNKLATKLLPGRTALPLTMAEIAVPAGQYCVER